MVPFINKSIRENIKLSLSGLDFSDVLSAKEVKVYSEFQRSALYPCFVVDLKKITHKQELTPVYEVVFDINIFSDNDKDIAILLEKALECINQDTLSLKSYKQGINNLSGKVLVGLYLLSLDCLSVDWSQGQDLISKKVTIQYKCCICYRAELEDNVNT